MRDSQYTVRGSQIFKKSRIHLQILGARWVLWSKFSTEDAQFWSSLWTSLLSGALCSVHVNWWYVQKLIMLNILGAILQSLVTYMTRCLRHTAVTFHERSEPCAKLCMLLHSTISFSPLDVVIYCKILQSDWTVPYRYTQCKQQNVGGVQQSDWEEAKCLYLWCICSWVIKPFE